MNYIVCVGVTQTNCSYLQKWVAEIVEEYTTCEAFDASYNSCIMFWKHEHTHSFKNSSILHRDDDQKLFGEFYL